MIPISLLSEYPAFILYPNATLASSQPLYLAQPTQISDLIINVRGRKADLEGNFRVTVAYFNEAGNVLSFHFSANIQDKNEVEIVYQINPPDFLCTLIKFLPVSLPKQEIGLNRLYCQEPLILLIEVYKFDDEFEKMHFLDK